MGLNHHPFNFMLSHYLDTWAFVSFLLHAHRHHHHLSLYYDHPQYSIRLLESTCLLLHLNAIRPLWHHWEFQQDLRPLPSPHHHRILLPLHLRLNWLHYDWLCAITFLNLVLQKHHDRYLIVQLLLIMLDQYHLDSILDHHRHHHLILSLCFGQDATV